MTSFARISLKNMFRSLIYLMYRQYDRRLKNKISVYDMQVMSLIRRLPIDAVCIDIGVNEAQLFDVMVKHCTKGRLYGFEPIPHLYEYLKKKYDDPRVTLFPSVVSDEEGQVSFYYFPQRTGVSGIAKRDEFVHGLDAREYIVRTVVLDELLDLARIDLIKIDVEGAELKVLHGAKKLIKKCRPVIVFECGYGGLDYFNATPEDVYEFFDGLGYGLSLVEHYLNSLSPMDRHTFLYTFKHGYEYQYLARAL